MPQCPLTLRQCTISSQVRAVCPMRVPRCPLNFNNFSRAQLMQELERWNNTSLLSAGDQFNDDPELATTVNQLRSDIRSVLEKEEFDPT